MFAGTDVSLTPTREIVRIVRLGTRRLTRAHLALHTKPSLANAANALVAPAAQVVGEQIGSPLQIQARLLDGSFVPRATLPRTSGYAVVELAAANSVAILDIDLPFLVAVLGRIAGTPTRTGPATAFTRIEEAAFGLVALTAISFIRRNERFEREFSPRLTSITTDRLEVLARVDDRQPYLVIELRFTLGEEVGVGRLLVPARTVQILSETFPSATDPTSPLELPDAIAGATVEARALCGTSQLTAAQLATLHAGDVVLFEDLRLNAGQIHGPARVATALFDLFGDLTPAGFVTQRGTPRVFPQEPPMSQNPASPSSAFPPLPLEVEVELTRLRLSVSEVANLRAGSLIPLHINSSEPVVLRVGDRAVARAELVEIEGEVGARILALLP